MYNTIIIHHVCMHCDKMMYQCKLLGPIENQLAEWVTLFVNK